jgi:hypothetical protein
VVAFLDDTTHATDPRSAYIPRWFSGTWNPRNDVRFRQLTPADWAMRKEVFARQRELVTLLHRAGVSFLAGTHLSGPYIYPGASLHEELRNLVGAGFTAREAPTPATVNPARYFQATDSLGTVAAGQLADLVVLDADPLADIANAERVHAVQLDGRLLTADDRARLLAEGRRLAGGALNGVWGGGGVRGVVVHAAASTA